MGRNVSCLSKFIDSNYSRNTFPLFDRNAHITVLMPSSGSLVYKDDGLTNGGTVARYNYGGSDTFSVVDFHVRSFLQRSSY